MSNTDWVEVSVTVENEVAEAVAEVFSRYAYRGVVIEAGPEGWHAGPVVVKAYLPADDQLRTKRRRIEEALWHLGQIRPIPRPAFRPLRDEDWAEAWKEGLDVLHIGRRFVIQPSWRDYRPAPEELVIRLDPGQAFGTGLHPTTQLCVVALEKLMWPGGEVLDLGTGSGILAIAAAKLGAAHVLAVDTDSVAVRSARANLIANGVDSIADVVRGSLTEASGSYDLIVVNILAQVILEMVQQGLGKRVCPGGFLVLSGVLADQAPEVAMALKQEGLGLVERWQIDDWVCLTVS